MVLLKTKFLPPVVSAKTVVRSRLHERLRPRPDKRATFVLAPAGFGKSTLIAQWLRDSGLDFAWLALDASDNSLQGFWNYLVGALHGIWPNLGHEALRALGNSKEAFDSLPAITALLNEMAERCENREMPACLVLDDYHLVDNVEIHRSLAYFLDYLPPGFMLILASRVEPDLPLARWRVKSRIDEIHGAELRFTPEEIQSFFRNYAGTELTGQDLDMVARDTDGWIAAIQLMLLSQGQTPQVGSGNIGTLLAEGRRLIDDYVLAEILDQQSAEVRGFLRDCALLLRLNPELCDAIRGQSDSREILIQLERANLFLLPLDNQQYWYRFHDLFREALLSHVLATAPEQARRAQQAAINWYLDHEYYLEAISQLIELKDWDWLARVLEERGHDLIRSGYHLSLLEWFQQLPGTLLESSPRLAILRIWCLFYDNRIETLSPLLGQARLLLNSLKQQGALSEDEFSQLDSELFLLESYRARAGNQRQDTSGLSRQVLERIEQTNIPLKSLSYYGVALDYFAGGELGMAVEALEAAIHHGKLERRYSTVLSSLGLLMWIHHSRGDLAQALSINKLTQFWLDNFHRHQPQPDLVSCWRNTALCEIYREQNNPIAAQAYLNPLLKYFETTEPGQRIMIHYAQAGLAFSQGAIDFALEHLDLAQSILEQKQDQIMFEPPNPAAMKLRCYLALGQLDLARLQAEHLQSNPARSPLNRQQERLCLARLHLAQNDPQTARQILAEELNEARNKGYGKHLIQGLILLSLAHREQGEFAEADRCLVEALELAESQGSLRLFPEESRDLAHIIANLSSPRISEHFRNSLLACFPAQQPSASDEGRREPSPSAGQSEQPPAASLNEPLSRRELEILQLIHEGLANKQIAQQLNLASATVKAHIRNIYGKLGVGSRTEALARARRLGLLD